MVMRTADFPKKGILFWDVTTILLNPKAFQATTDLFVERYKDMKIDVVAGKSSDGGAEHVGLRPRACAAKSRTHPGRQPHLLLLTQALRRAASSSVRHWRSRSTQPSFPCASQGSSQVGQSLTAHSPQHRVPADSSRTFASPRAASQTRVLDSPACPCARAMQAPRSASPT